MGKAIQYHVLPLNCIAIVPDNSKLNKKKKN
jgi:hypothetical protein